MSSFEADTEKAQRLLTEAYQLQIKGKLEEAIESYKSSLEIYPTAEAYTFLGWALSYKGLYIEAIEHCKQAIEIDPDFGNPYNDIGAYLIEMGDLPSSKEWFEKALEASRYEAKFYALYNLGRVYEHEENWFRALSYYQEAYRENPDYALAEKAIVKIQSKLN